MAAVEEGIEVLGAETKKTLSVHERMTLNLFLSTRGLEMVHEGEEVVQRFCGCKKMGKCSTPQNTQGSLHKIPSQ